MDSQDEKSCEKVLAVYFVKKNEDMSQTGLFVTSPGGCFCWFTSINREWKRNVVPSPEILFWRLFVISFGSCWRNRDILSKKLVSSFTSFLRIDDFHGDSLSRWSDSDIILWKTFFGKLLRSKMRKLTFCPHRVDITNVFFLQIFCPKNDSSFKGRLHLRHVFNT